MTKGFSEAWQAKESLPPEQETPEAQPPRALRELFSRLTWLSLVGLHPCRAQLRFTRQRVVYLETQNVVPTLSQDQSFKIDTSAYRVGYFKTDTSAYRVDATPQVRWALDKLASLV